MASPEEQLVGHTIAGYEFVELVGEGGMGAVYRGRQMSLDREVALKVLSPRLAGDDEFVQRFNREARSIAKVNHPHILQVYDVVEAEGLHMIAMEFVCGKNLTELLADKGFLEWRECAEIMRQAAMGLASAAKVNIIHRDIKPDNLMLTDDKVVKVSDFGLAKEVSSMDLTQTGDLMGTPAYMSPEQCDGESLDTRTDIYSLGATFYRSVTGMLPFTAATPVAMMYKQKHEALIPPKEYMPSLPDSVNEIIIRMMAKEPNERFSTMELVAETLDKALQGDTLEDLDKTIQLHAKKSPRRRRTSSARMVRDEFSFEKPPSVPPAPPPPAKPSGGSGEPIAGSFDKLVAMGDQLMKEGRPVAACDCWRRALALKPDDQALKQRIEQAKSDSTVASLKIGEDLLEQGKMNAIRADLEKQLQFDPTNIDAREKLAALEYMDQKKRNAIRQIRQLLAGQQHEKALEIWKDLHPSLRDRALIPTMTNIEEHVLPAAQLGREALKLSEDGQYEEAVAKWDEAIRLDPSNDKLKLGRQNTVRAHDRLEGAMREGYDYSVKRQFDLAIECFDRVLALAPDHAQAIRYRMEAYLELARDAENAFDFGSAIKRWREVLDADPGNKNAMKHLEECTRKRNAVSAALENAQTAMNRGRYSKAIKLWNRALKIQPFNKNAKFGIKEARRQRFRRRYVPVTLLLLIAALVAGGVQYYKFRAILDSGDVALRASGPKSMENYDKAVKLWRQAAEVAVFGQLYEVDIAQRIQRVNVLREVDRTAIMYEEGNIDALIKQVEVLRDLAKTKARYFPNGKPIVPIFAAEWHIAELYRRQGEYEKAFTHYENAQEIMKKSSTSLPLPRIQENYHEAIRRYLKAKEIESDERLNTAERRKQLLKNLEEAIELWPELSVAVDWLSEVRGQASVVDRTLAKARKVLSAGREQSKERGQWSAAKTTFGLAVELAEQVLELGGNWEAEKIKAEANWRMEAGPDMVVFLYPLEDDPDAERIFRAFALDRYEWPNRRGAVPLNVPFKEAIRIAGEAGKSLPLRQEWQWAAQGGKESRLYPYGDSYDATKGNTGNRQVDMRPKPAGWSDKAATPEGVYDMAGNVAEWVIDENRGMDEPEQIVMGGDFTSGKDSRSLDWKSVPANLSERTIGFRAAKRWKLVRDTTR